MLNFFYILWYVDMGEDYTSQSRSQFDWYNPHLYSFSQQVLPTTSISFEEQ